MIIPDLPICKSSDDLLNRSSFARDLADVIVKYSSPTSFSVGIYGKWGSGKTSLINMVLESVEEMDPQALVIKFNPWLCSDHRQLVSQFFRQLSAAVRLKSSASVALYRIIDKYGDLLDATSIVPLVGPALAAVGKATTSRARARVNEIENNLQQQKDNIVKLLNEERIKIVVSIDDIDRLTEAEIVAVFQLVRTLADFPNTVYLLAFDYATVVKALETVQHGDGREYLEKVVQVPFQIPTPNMDCIYSSLFSKLNSIIGNLPEDRWDNHIWTELFHWGIKPYITSLRDVIRYSNVFFLKYQLLSKESNIVDLLGITCLQVFEPLLYSGMPAMKSILCGNAWNISSRRQDEIERSKKELQTLIDTTVNGHQEPAKQILGILFPNVRTLLSLHIGGRDYNQKELLFNRNVADAACFDRYFSLALEENAIPTSLLSQMITEMTSEELSAQFEMLEISGRINRLIDELIAFVDSKHSNQLSDERSCIIINALLQQWVLLTHKKDAILINNTARVSYLVKKLLLILAPESRSRFLSSLFQDSTIPIPALAKILDVLEEPHGLTSKKRVTENEQIISLEEVQSLEKSFVSRSTEAFINWINGLCYDKLEYLWKLEELVPELNPVEKIDVSTDIALAFIISTCTSHGWSFLPESTRYCEIIRSSLDKYIQWDNAFFRMEKYVSSEEFFTLPEDVQMDVVAFLLTHRLEQEASEDEDKQTTIPEESIKKEISRLSSLFEKIEVEGDAP